METIGTTEILYVVICVVVFILLILLRRNQKLADKSKWQAKEIDRLQERITTGNSLCTQMSYDLRASIWEKMDENAEYKVTPRMAILFKKDYPTFALEEYVYAPILKKGTNLTFFNVVGATQHLKSRWDRGQTGFSDENPQGVRIGLETYEKKRKQNGVHTI